MKLFIKKSLLIGIMINLNIGLNLYAADPSEQKAKKRLDILTRQLQSAPVPISNVKPEDVAATQTFLEESGYCEDIRNMWIEELIEHRDLIKKMLENEILYEPTHFVFYHAQNQDNYGFAQFLRNLYNYEHPKDPLHSDFEFLRFWQDGSKYSNVNDYLDSFGIPNPFVPKKGNLNDYNERIQAVLLSVNPTIFGNFNSAAIGECTYDYFLQNRSIQNATRKSLERIFKKNQFKSSFIDDLLNINKQFQSKTGNIIQIFIPKNLVNSCTYFAKPWGVPRGAPFVDAQGNPIANNDYDAKRKRYIKTNTILEIVQNKTGIIEYSASIQLRLFFSKTGPLLNPNMGAKVFYFTTLSEEQLQNYKEQIRNVSEKIFAQRPTSASQIKKIFPGSGVESRSLTTQESSTVEQSMKNLTTPNNLLQAVRVPNAIEIVTKMLKNGANINMYNRRGETPLMHAAQYGNVGIVSFLLQHGANIKAIETDDKNVLFYAINNKDLNVLQFLIDEGVPVDSRDILERTPLILACRNGRLKAAQLLIDNKADVNALDSKKESALMLAVTHEHLDVVQLLLKANVNIYATNDENNTALQIAKIIGNKDIIALLQKAQNKKQTPSKL
ncbi:MAG TPA: ankyrin repeat domain-containing protein [Candidatus Babeliales bacterium]|nr:ankyrin repeat domain-containing protein [Candidatus Babeliales bacterium]